MVDASEKAKNAFKLLTAAPWRSSGLTENNAFTTTLVLRALGFLVEAGVLPQNEPQKPKNKDWNISFGLKNVESFTKKVMSRKNDISEFIFLSLSEKTRDTIEKWLQNKTNKSLRVEVEAALKVDLDRMLHGPWLFEEKRFENVRLSEEILTTIKLKPTGYKLAQMHRKMFQESYPKEFEPTLAISFQEIANELFKKQHFSFHRS